MVARSASLARRAGMTLVEVMITLTIVAIMATTVVLGLGVADRGVTVQTEANRLTEVLGAAIDEVLVTRRPLALAWDAEGYSFVTQGPDGRWTKDLRSNLGSRHELPGGLSLSGDVPGLLVIGADAQTSTASLSVSGPQQTWTVVFDGIGAKASPVEAT